MSVQIKICDLLTDNDTIIGRPIVINVDKDVQRWNDICSHLEHWDINPVRFDAITGVKLPGLPKHMSESDYSCSLNLSHAAVSRQQLYHTTQLHWLVLEDDCRFIDDPRLILAQALSHLSNHNIDWSVISLGCFSYEHQAKRPPLEPEMLCGSYAITQPTDWFPWGSHAYLVNRKYAAHIISSLSACFWPADHLLLQEYASKRGYLIRPSITYQEEYMSYFAGGKSTSQTKISADLPPAIIDKICKK